MATAAPTRPTTERALPPVPRVGALDRLRAIALLLLLVHHLTDWFAGEARTRLPGWPGFAVTDLAAPAFALAAGASAVLFCEAQRRAGASASAITVDVVRRYGLLVVYGVLIHWALWRDPFGWGVLETLGVAVVVSTLLARVLPTGWLVVAAALVLASGSAVATEASGWDGFGGDVLGGGFPLVTYVGFALAGAVGGRLLLRDPARGAEALLLGGVLTLVVAVGRHPGTVGQLAVPGIAGTLLLYGWLGAVRLRPRAVDTLVRRAGRHTLGVFLGHYAIYAAVRWSGNLGALPPAAGVTAAVGAAVAMVWLAPRVPTLPWSPRTGRATRPSSPG